MDLSSKFKAFKFYVYCKWMKKVWFSPLHGQTGSQGYTWRSFGYTVLPTRLQAKGRLLKYENNSCLICMHKFQLHGSCILYFIIVRERLISASRAARGLKFWLQVALSAPIATTWTEIRKSGSGKSGFPDPDFRICFHPVAIRGP